MESVFLALQSAAKNSDDVGEEESITVYRRLGELSGDKSHETFWERVMEHSSEGEGYWRGAEAFGKNLRELTEGKDHDYPETLIREAYMRRKIQETIASGIAPDKIVVVTGAYHVQGLKNDLPALSDQE